MFPSARPVQGGRTQHSQRAQQRQGSGVTGAASSSPLAQSAEPPPEGDPIHSGNMSSGESRSDYNNSGSRPGSPSGSRPSSPAGNRASGTSGTESDSEDDSGWENGPDGWRPNDGWTEPTSLLGRAAYAAATAAAVPIVLGWELAGAIPLRMKQALVLASLPTLAGTINWGRPVKDPKVPVVDIWVQNPDPAKNTSFVQCTGTLVDQYTVVTAQHCVLDAAEYTVWEEDNPCTTEEPNTAPTTAEAGATAGTVTAGDDDEEATIEDVGESGEGSGADVEGSGSGGESYDYSDYGDYSEPCGPQEVTKYNTSVADPSRVNVFHGLTNENSTMVKAEKIIIRHGFDLNNASTLPNDIAIIKLKEGFANLHYPHLLNATEYRKLRKDLHSRDAKWNKRKEGFVRYYADKEKADASNGTLTQPTLAPFEYNKPNAKSMGWGVFKTPDLLRKEESGEVIGVDKMWERNSTDVLLKGELGIRSHQRFVIPNDTMPEDTSRHGCDKELLCQETIPRTAAACPGDSGGPLFRKPRADDKREILIGVTSRSDCSRGGQYVGIHKHKSWIERHMGKPEGSTTPTSRPPGESNLVDTTLPSAPASSGAVSRRPTTASTTTTPTPKTTVRFKDTKVKFWKGQGESGPGEPSQRGQEPQGAASDSKGKGFWKGQGQGGTQHRPQHGGHHHGQGAHHREEHGAIDERRSSRGQSSGGHRQPEREQHAGGSSHHREEHGAIDERRSSRGQSHYHHHGGQGSDEPPRLGQGNRSWKGRSSRGDQ